MDSQLKARGSLATRDKSPVRGEPISFVGLKAQQQRIRGQLEARMAAVLEHGMYVNGPEIAELEQALAQRTGAADVVLCGNGTEALEFAMMGEGIGRGDAVFIPSFTYNATASAVIMVGATPVFVDVDAKSFNIDPGDLACKADEIRKAGALRPRMVIPVDLFGLPADYRAIDDVARAFGMTILADAAQSFGGWQDGRWVGSIAPMSTTSFFPSKPLGCYGDGGAIFTRDAGRGEVWRSIRWHGTDSAHKESVRPGTNGRLDTLQAAILLAKLAVFDSELERRHEIAALYDRRLGNAVDLPARPDRSKSGWSLYSLTFANRDRVAAALADANIATAIYYKIPLHQMTAFARFAPPGGLPVCEKLSRHILSLPMHPYLTDDEIHRVCDVVMAAL